MSVRGAPRDGRRVRGRPPDRTPLGKINTLDGEPGDVEDPESDTSSAHGDPTGVATLTLSADERWTLHHVLLDRIHAGATVIDADHDDPPPVAVVGAFETLDAGETTFTVAQLEAVREVLATYHHSATWWEVERPRIERLLHRVSAALEAAGFGPERA